MFQVIFSVFIISSSLLFSKISSTFLNPSIYRFKVIRLEHCDEQEKWNISLNFVNFKVMNQDGINTDFAGIMDIVKPIQINFRLSVHGLLCDGPTDRSCTHKFIRQFGYICRKLHDKGRPWYDFIKERFTCPIPTGYYNMGTMRININSLSHLPLGMGYWVIKAIGYQGKAIIMCVYSEMEITAVKGRYSRRMGNRNSTQGRTSNTGSTTKRSKSRYVSLKTHKLKT